MLFVAEEGGIEPRPAHASRLFSKQVQKPFYCILYVVGGG